ncbi:hypothetical protein B0H34DRAFT_529111 [Crassisporium funariophilum]|nr:hypothetical protein B0H34DRAFT_529111 [Crassisporium funariophilum]
MEILRDVTLKNGTSPSLLARTGARARCLQGFNYKHTREALSRLHVRHVELASVKEGVTASATVTNTDERLDAALRRLGIDCNGSEDIKLKLIALARKRTTAANRKTSRRARLTAVAESNEEKEREIQSKISRVVGLGYLSERHIEVLTNSESLSSSRSMVEQECKRVKGYIDVLRLGILQEREAKKQIYKPGNASTEHQVIQCETRLRDLKAVSRRVQEGDDAVDPEMRLMNGDNVKLAEALLRRKGDKALHGFKIAKEIETLLKEARQIK